MDFGSGGGGAPQLAQIETEQLAFQSVSGEDKLKLLSSPWPVDNLPPATSSLLSVASVKGLVAAAGPDTLVVASTESLRQSFINGAAQEHVKNFTPQATIQIPRISQLAFSSDESCLVITAEQGGGLAVYDTNSLTNGGKEPAFQLSTEGESVRQLLPNPNPQQDLSRFFGVVTSRGKLLLADLQERKLVQGSNGSAVFHENVSCACWSRLGKQIIAGLADGTAVQIDQQGAVKGNIPEPPQLAGLKEPSAQQYPITSIFWLETFDFLTIHTPIYQGEAAGSEDSIYHLAHKDKQTQSWSFSRFEDPCPPFGMERRPSHHFVQRLREWGSLSELLILASTGSTDIGLFTRSKSPLDANNPITDVFTHTQPPDQRRAAMPMNVLADGDTSPIGVALDLSTKERIQRPIPNDESIEESPVPLPAFYVLNNEGMLSMWWIVFNESVRQKQAYPDLVAAGGPRPLGADQKQSANAAPVPPMQPAAAAAPSSLGFAKPGNETSPFGQTPGSGAPATPAFGGTSSIGGRQSPWAGPSSVATGGSSFGKPSFGTPSAPSTGSGFGQVGGMGANKGSVWGAPQQQKPSAQTPSASSGGVFGGNTSTQSPFMNIGGGAAPSPFGKANVTSPLGQPAKSNSVFGGASTTPASSPFANLGGKGSAASTFGQPSGGETSLFGANKPTLSAEPSGSTVSFGTGSSFNSGSTTFGIKSEPSGGFISPNPQSGSLFGKASSREESMDDDSSSQPSTVRPAEENKNPFGVAPGGFKLGSTFKGDGTAKDDLPKPKNPGAGLFGKGFGEALGDSTSKGPAAGSEQAAWLSSGTSTPIKKEPGSEEGKRLSDIPPAAPSSTPAPKVEKKAAPPVDDAPLPPDPTTWKPKPGALPPPTPPGFDFSKPKKDEDVSKIPADATRSSNTDVDKVEPEKSLAGSPPVDLGHEKFSEGAPSESEAAGPEEEDWSDEDEGEDEDDEEGEEEEAEEDDEAESEDQGTPEVTDQKGLSAFEARLTPASPKRAEQPSQEESTTPATDKKDSYTPAGLPKAPIMFQPPTRKGQESPRSPSPIRSATSPQRTMPSFNFGSSKPQSEFQQKAGVGSRTPSQHRTLPDTHVQTKSTASSLFGSSQPSASTEITPRQSTEAIKQPPSRIAVPPAQLVGKPKASSPVKPAEPDAGMLEDQEDARIQAILASPPDPTLDVPSFLAHQEYVAGDGEKVGLGGQIERVYRDINSMIDTLALNARNLSGFVEGNRHPPGSSRNRMDLEDETSWRLGEAEDLVPIMDGIDVELEDGRLEEVGGLLDGLREEEKQMLRLKTNGIELRKQIQARRDPDHLTQQHNAPLPMELQAQQSDLRNGVQQVQKLLAKAEEQVSVLRAELASLPQRSNDGKAAAAVPTVEAVTNTILKMTAMIEKKSGDIDVLESKIRRLGGLPSTAAAASVDDLTASLRASHLSPVVQRGSRVSALGSPARLRSSRIGGGIPGQRKSLFDVPDEEAETYRAKKEARRRAMGRLRDLVSERGVKVVKVGGS